MLGRAEKVTAGAMVVEGLVAAGTVGPRGRVETRAVKTAGVSGVKGCGAVGATEVARLAEAGCCAAGATKVARLAEAGGCWAAGTAGGCRECTHSPDMYEAWLRSATAMTAAVEHFWASREARRASCSLRVRVVSSIPAREVTEVPSRAAIFVRRGRSSRSCSAATMSSACWSAVVRAWAMPSSTSQRETNLILACISGFRLSQTGARCRRWRGGPGVAAWKARGSGAAGRNPRVRPVSESELPRMSVESTGEVSRGGREAEGGDEAVLLRVLEGEVVGEDMLREARKGARGENSRGGPMGPVVKGGGLAASVLVTRGVVAGIRYSCTGACRWGVKGRVERYISGIWAGTIFSSIAFERTVPGGEVSSATSRVARKASRCWERSALSVNGEVHYNGSVVTIAELEGGEGRASMSNSTVEINAVNGVWGGSFSTSRGGITGDRSGAVEAVQAARPVSGDTPRTSI